MFLNDGCMPKISETERNRRQHGLVVAALRCLRTESYDRLTVEKICAAAGSSKGSFYLYFSSKHDLLLALLDEQANTFEQLIEELDDRALEGSEWLEEFILA